MKNKYYYLAGVLAIILIAVGGTYAYFSFASTDEQKTNVSVNVDGLNITYNGGTNIDDLNLRPTLVKEDGISKSITIGLADSYTIDICANFYLALTTLPVELQEESFKYELYKASTKVGEGNFAGKTQGETIQINNRSLSITTTIDTYTLYLWIDGNMINPINMANKTFSFDLSAGTTNCPIDTSGANPPVLPNGMIPIMWDASCNSNAGCWVKADSNNTNETYVWYDYTNKQWANAVMVNSAYQTNYMDNAITPMGTEIPEENILSYYVWIPRYNYTLFNVDSLEVTAIGDGSYTATNPPLINVEFQSPTDTKYTGTTNGTKLTHPAFTWGTQENGDLKELEGIWVGKFETTGSTTSPTVKPNLFSLLNLTVSQAYNTIKRMDSTTYLTTDGVTNSDVHMIKNTEWGAVAYLKQSIYGLGQPEVALNSYTGYQAGCGPQSEGSIASGTICNAYTSVLGQSASTTGNIYGVYDTSGGLFEYVMGGMKSSGVNINYSDSNFTTSTMPYSMCSNNTYLNCYENSSNSNDYTRRILGDATGETQGWYSDYSLFVNSTLSWFTRGGFSEDDSSLVGTFGFWGWAGSNEDYLIGTRSVAIVLED